MQCSNGAPETVPLNDIAVDSPAYAVLTVVTKTHRPQNVLAVL